MPVWLYWESIFATFCYSLPSQGYLSRSLNLKLKLRKNIPKLRNTVSAMGQSDIRDKFLRLWKAEVRPFTSLPSSTKTQRIGATEPVV